MNKGNTGEKEEYLKKIKCKNRDCRKVIAGVKKNKFFDVTKHIKYSSNGETAIFKCSCGEENTWSYKKIFDF